MLVIWSFSGIKSSLSWNIIFPLLLILGFSFVFDGDDKNQFKVGVLKSENSVIATKEAASEFFELRYIELVDYQQETLAVDSVRKHKIDLVLAPEQQRYWVNESSRKAM